MLIAVLDGRQTGLLAEYAAQIRRVVVVQALGYFLYGEVGGVEKHFYDQTKLDVDLLFGCHTSICA